jgi:AcrR family transcriptional regulator
MSLVPTTSPAAPAPARGPVAAMTERAAACLTPSPGGLRARKKQQRHDALVDAAQTLVLARGLDAVTVEDICAQVGVSPRTFFNYFPSKDDAVLGAEDVAVRPETAAAFVAGGPTGALLDDLEVVVADLLVHQPLTPERMARTLELLQREPRLLTHHMTWMDGHRAQLIELFEARRREHPFVPDPELLALVVMSLLHASTREWHKDQDGAMVDHLRNVVDQLRALVGDTART